jgi:hypothetical protein
VEEDGSNEIISIVVVAGPLSFSDSMKYSPFIELVKRINSKAIICNTLIILGPILDEGNQLITESSKEFEE